MARGWRGPCVEYSLGVCRAAPATPVSACLSWCLGSTAGRRESACRLRSSFSQDSFLSGFKIESQHLSLSYIPNNQNCEEGSPIRGSGMTCFLFGFSSFCPYAPVLVLEEGAGLTRSPEGFSLLCLRTGPHLDHAVGLVVALGGEQAFTCAAGSGRGEPGGEGSAPAPDAWPEGAAATALLLFSGTLIRAQHPVQAEQGQPGRRRQTPPRPCDPDSSNSFQAGSHLWK